MSTSIKTRVMFTPIPSYMSPDVVLNASPSAMFALDKHGIVLLWNPAAESLFGWSKEEVLGGYCPIVPDDHKNEFLEVQEKTFHGQRSDPAVTVMVKKDRSRVTVSSSAVPVRGEIGLVMAALYIITDLTEQVRIDRERECFFSLSNDLLCIVGMDGYFKRVNPAFVRALQYSAQELCSVPFSVFVHPDDRGSTLDELNRLRFGERSIILENHLICKDGTVRSLNWVCQAAPKNEQLFYAVVRDNTEWMEIEADREKLISQLSLALASIKSMDGVLPICSGCKKIRDEQGKWMNMEEYISGHTNAQFSHSICHDCTVKLYPDFHPESKNENEETEIVIGHS